MYYCTYSFIRYFGIRKCFKQKIVKGLLDIGIIFQQSKKFKSVRIFFFCIKMSELKIHDIVPIGIINYQERCSNLTWKINKDSEIPCLCHINRNFSLGEGIDCRFTQFCFEIQKCRV